MPTDDELDNLARRLIPKLDRMAERAMEEPHDFDTEPNIEHRRKLQLRGGRHTDPVGLTDSVEVKVTTAFGPAKACAIGAHAMASADTLELILELYPGQTGRLELYLCPTHRQDLLTSYRRRAITGKFELHFAGRRILAVDPKPLEVAEVLEATSELL